MKSPSQTLEKIAREAARKAFVDNENYIRKHDPWRMLPDLPVTEELLTSIIISAITKANEDCPVMSAQAAIEKIKTADDISEEVALIAADIDLSLLHQHDTELRDKWLVEVKESMELHDAALRAQWDKEHEHVL